MARRESRSKREARKAREAQERAIGAEAAAQERAVYGQEPRTRKPRIPRSRFEGGEIGARSADELVEFGAAPRGAAGLVDDAADMAGGLPSAAAGAAVTSAAGAVDLTQTLREVPEITKALEQWLADNKNQLPKSMEKAEELFAQMGVSSQRFQEALKQKRWYGIKGNPLKNLVEGGFSQFNAEKAVASMESKVLAEGLTKGFTPVVDFLKGESTMTPSTLAKHTKDVVTVSGQELGLTGLVKQSVSPLWKAAGVIGVLYGAAEATQQITDFASPVPNEIDYAKASMMSPEDQIYQDMANEAQVNQTLGTMSAYPFLLDKMGAGMMGGGGRQPPKTPGVLQSEISSAGRTPQSAVAPTGGEDGDLLGLGI